MKITYMYIILYLKVIDYWQLINIIFQCYMQQTVLIYVSFFVPNSFCRREFIYFRYHWCFHFDRSRDICFVSMCQLPLLQMVKTYSVQILFSNANSGRFHINNVNQEKNTCIYKCFHSLFHFLYIIILLLRYFLLGFVWNQIRVKHSIFYILFFKNIVNVSS